MRRTNTAQIDVAPASAGRIASYRQEFLSPPLQFRGTPHHRVAPDIAPMTERNELVTLLRLLDEALEIPLPERAVWLEALGREQPAVAQKLAEMLASEERLDRVGFMADFPATPQTRGGLAGRTLGAYTL